MKIAKPSALVQRLLRIYAECGGVVEVVFVDIQEESAPAGALHRDAAMLALTTLKQRVDDGSDQRWRKSGGNPLDYFRMTIADNYVAAGQRISVHEFLNGPAVPEAPYVMNAGFVHAFCDPPHGLRADPDRLFFDFRRMVLHGLPPETEVWRWEPEGSNHFEAGKEWWGSYFWTVRPTPAPVIVALLASTTD